jgi:hypothetical protein
VAYEASTKQLLLFGGLSGYPRNPNPALGDTWTWDGTKWTSWATVAVSPWARERPVAVYNSAANSTILYGGYIDDGSGWWNYFDTWQWASGTWTLVQPSTVAAPQSMRHDIELVGAAGLGKPPTTCSSGSQTCQGMTVLGQAMLGEDSAYVIFQMPPGSSHGPTCASYLSSVTITGNWTIVRQLCGAPATMPQLGGHMYIHVDTCASVRTFPRTGEIVDCLKNGTVVVIDDGPIAMGSSTIADYWWHLKGRGWINHQLIAP